jgi:hypothetical protein
MLESQAQLTCPELKQTASTSITNVVLVGHVYSWMVITGVVTKEPRRLAHLVYFDAYVPFEGENESSRGKSQEAS